MLAEDHEWRGVLAIRQSRDVERQNLSEASRNVDDLLVGTAKMMMRMPMPPAQMDA